MRARGPTRRRYRGADLLVLSFVAVLVIVLGATSSRGGGWADGAHADTVTINPFAAGAVRVPAGFLGLSLEYPAVTAYAGRNPAALDPVFINLVRDLAPGAAPVIRIGGDSADWSWWPEPGLKRPAGATFALGSTWLAVTRALTAKLGARLLLGINLEANDPAVASAEATALVNGLGSSTIRALELGNEPELYGRFAWYRTPSGRGIRGRPSSYSFTSFNRDFATTAAAMPSLPLAGPTFGSFAWTPRLEEFLSAQSHLGIVTLHRYPLQACYIPPGSPRYPSLEHLLSPAASTGLAQQFAPLIAEAHAHGLPLRFDELNTVSCGAARRVSDTFAAALWSVDALFELAHAGIDGVNVHTFPGAGYELFQISHTAGGWRAAVSPQFYGLLLFARATPPGSELLRPPGAPSGPLKAWATLAPDRTLRVVVINKDVDHASTVSLRVIGAHGPAAVQWLRAPSAAARAGVTLGGQSFGPSTSTGVLAGTPSSTTVTPGAGRYRLSLAPASAALITFRAP